jgi:16S rRNA (guanine527-N7)-methyltransferase
MGGQKGGRRNVSRETSPAWRDRPLDELLTEAAYALGLTLAPAETARLLDYLAELTRWNRKTNLVASALPADLVLLHLADSLAPLADLPETGPLTVLDIGSGAGLPGLVFKILRPAWQITLAESSPKKTAFLKSAVLRLGLEGLRVRTGRLSETAGAAAGRFTLIAARALAPLPRFLRLAWPCLAPGGTLLAYKGPRAGLELEAAAGLLDELGLVLSRRRNYQLPYLNRQRVLLYFREKEREG